MNVDFRKLLMILLPISLRVSGWIKTILNGVATQFNIVQSSFENVMSLINYDLRITPQVCYIEKVLNDYFQTTPRIEIIDGSIFCQCFLPSLGNQKWSTLMTTILLEIHWLVLMIL